jgi:zinc/manganese transport system permease protein
MSEAFYLMLWPMLACFVLVGIHAYLGIHVIARKVIFVDLALAQIAALGAVYAVALGFSFDSNWFLLKLISVGFTLVGAALFSFTRSFDNIIPHEVIIGIIYATALSLTLVLVANLPHGSESVTQLLSGNILWVTKDEVMWTALLYALIGLIHIIFRKQFFRLSFTSTSQKLASLWDFLFYATFGVVVTSSVGMGGVLLVFSYLVIPSLLGILLGESILSRLLWAWAWGLVVSFVGVLGSFYLDLPSGPLIVVALSFTLVLVSLFISMKDGHKRSKVILNVLIITGLILIVIGWPLILKHNEEHLHFDERHGN